jgi:esterase/lipase superfamily enzyme
MICDSVMRQTCLRAGVLLLTLLSACASDPPVSIDLMPAPDVYDDADFNPLPGQDPYDTAAYSGLLYATDRLPTHGEGRERFYANERGNVLRLGLADVKLGDGAIDWEEAKRISLLKNRAASYPLSVSGVDEIGVLRASVTPFDPMPDQDAAAPFAELINARLAASTRQDIFIYVHGYKVVFENPILVASELWHFLGYDGVMIAYAWPSTPSKLAYVSDVETAAVTARNLRLLIEYLSRETQVRRIHIIGYSAGSRVVLGALGQLTLLHADDDTTHPALDIGRVVLVGSDYDRELFGTYLSDGLLSIVDDVTVYISPTDKALGISRMLFARARLGESVQDADIGTEVRTYLEQNRAVNLINVSNAASSDTGNGHAYFRRSPWVSSDILMSLYWDMSPSERGLIREPGAVIWQFPQDYPQRLVEAIDKRLPEN